MITLPSIAHVSLKRRLVVVAQLLRNDREGSVGDRMERRESVPHRVESDPVEPVPSAVRIKRPTWVKSVAPGLQAARLFLLPCLLVGAQQVGGISRVNLAEVGLQELKQSGAEPDHSSPLAFWRESFRLLNVDDAAIEVDPVSMGLGDFPLPESSEKAEPENELQINAILGQCLDQEIALHLSAIPFGSRRDILRQIDPLAGMLINEALANCPGKEPAQSADLGFYGRGAETASLQAVSVSHDMSGCHPTDRRVAGEINKFRGDPVRLSRGGFGVPLLDPHREEPTGRFHPQTFRREFPLSFLSNTIISLDRFLFFFGLEGDRRGSDTLDHGRLVVVDAAICLFIQAFELHDFADFDDLGSKLRKQNQASLYTNIVKTGDLARRTFGVKRGLCSLRLGGRLLGIPCPVKSFKWSGRQDLNLRPPHPQNGGLGLVLLVANSGSKLAGILASRGGAV